MSSLANFIFAKPIPTPTPQRSKEETADMFSRLRRLVDTCGPNKNDVVDALIAACIMEGVNTLSQIIGVLTHLGFERFHIIKRVEYGTGTGSTAADWRRDDVGVYSLVD